MAHLTPRQAEILAYRAKGISDAKIAKKLGILESSIPKQLAYVPRNGRRGRPRKIKS